MHTKTIRVRINGRQIERVVPVRRLLADFLRDDIGLTGTHVGCEHGVCGACTVVVDGQTLRSCLTFACQVDGSDILTVEGLEDDSGLHPLQQSFWDHHGLQCGFCTPGMLMSSWNLLKECSKPTDQEIREALSGNVCRCTGYAQIVEAVQEAALRMNQEASIIKDGEK